MIRAVILVDIDGVIAGYDTRFFEMVDYHGFRLDIAGPHEQTRRYATDHVVDKHERKLARAITNAPGWFDGLPVMPGAIEGLAALETVAEVWLVTKPAIDNVTCRDEKFAWVSRELGKPWARRLMIVPDKSLVVGQVLLDDAPNPDWFERAMWRPVIFEAPFNGAGSKWENLRHWTWGDPYAMLYRKLAMLDTEGDHLITHKSA